MSLKDPHKINWFRYSLDQLDEDEIRSQLLPYKGIGPWTANIYLMTVLGRPDVWPNGDRALAVATKEIKNLHEVPSDEDLECLAEAWRPWRAVAARMLWHYYLRTPRKKQ